MGSFLITSRKLLCPEVTPLSQSVAPNVISQPKHDLEEIWRRNMKDHPLIVVSIMLCHEEKVGRGGDIGRQKWRLVDLGPKYNWGNASVCRTDFSIILAI